MKKILVALLLISLGFSTPSFADSPDLTFDYKPYLSTDTFKVKIYKKKLKSKGCNSYLSFDIKRKIGKGKKDPMNETVQRLVMFFSALDESKPDKKGSFIARYTFKWGNYKNNVGYKTLYCWGSISKENTQKPIIIWLGDSLPDGSYASFILN